MSVERRRYAGAHVLVTGGGGFIGRHLVGALLAEGAQAVTFGRTPVALEGVEHVRGDVRDDAGVSSLLDRRFDAVFHLAAYSGQVPGFTDHEQSLTTNCLGLLNILEAIRRLSPDTVLCLPSSRLVYGRTRCLPVGEDHPCESMSLYGINKRTGEEYCAYYGARWGIRSVVLRLSNPYGPHTVVSHNRYNVANWMIDQLVSGREVALYGGGTQLRDYVYVGDAVEAMLAATADERAHGAVYNVGSGVGVSMAGFVRTAISFAGAGAWRPEQWPDDVLQVETGDFVADITSIERAIGWRPRVSLAEGLAHTVATQRRALRGSGRRQRAAAGQGVPLLPASEGDVEAAA